MNGLVLPERYLEQGDDKIAQKENHQIGKPQAQPQQLAQEIRHGARSPVSEQPGFSRPPHLTATQLRQLEWDLK